MYFEANGIAVVAGSITLPRVGAWHADLVADAETAAGLSGRVTISLGDELRLVGTAVRAGARAQATFLRVVGGAGGLAETFSGKAYADAPLRVLLQNVLDAGGETPSPRSDQGLLATRIPKWIGVRQPVSQALASLVEVVDAVWRVLPDGTVWVGKESWPTTRAAYEVIDEAPELGRLEVASDVPVIYPGETLDGRKVDSVIHRADAHRVRTKVWFSDV